MKHYYHLFAAGALVCALMAGMLFEQEPMFAIAAVTLSGVCCYTFLSLSETKCETKRNLEQEQAQQKDAELAQSIKSVLDILQTIQQAQQAQQEAQKTLLAKTEELCTSTQNSSTSLTAIQASLGDIAKIPGTLDDFADDLCQTTESALQEYQKTCQTTCEKFLDNTAGQQKDLIDLVQKQTKRMLDTTSTYETDIAKKMQELSGTYRDFKEITQNTLTQMQAISQADNALIQSMIKESGGGIE